jgi:hypothetical protein
VVGGPCQGIPAPRRNPNRGARDYRSHHLEAPRLRCTHTAPLLEAICLIKHMASQRGLVPVLFRVLAFQFQKQAPNRSTVRISCRGGSRMLHLTITLHGLSSQVPHPSPSVAAPAEDDTKLCAWLFALDAKSIISPSISLCLPCYASTCLCTFATEFFC